MYYLDIAPSTSFFASDTLYYNGRGPAQVFEIVTVHLTHLQSIGVRSIGDRSRRFLVQSPSAARLQRRSNHHGKLLTANSVDGRGRARRRRSGETPISSDSEPHSSKES